ncbi:MAG TPA: VWA domain-containing protein [Mycobacteriales bacterium]|nr:VWA domain-containing protein [Mycobacteriales bacterium]
MAQFRAEVFQNEFLSDGTTDVHAIVSVRCTDAGVAGQTGVGDAAELVIVDTSGSMANPPDKITAVRAAAQVALEEIVDGTFFAVIAGTDTARVAYPLQPTEAPMVRMSAKTRKEAQAAVRRFQPNGGTAIGSWLQLATDVFAATPASQCHAILLTDGNNESEDPAAFEYGIETATGAFQCDCRGVGADWVVDELRRIATALLGTVDLIADPAEMEADFESMIKSAMSRGVARVDLRVWAPQGAEVLFVRQVAPTIDDLTPRRAPVSDLVGQYPTGSWGDESRDYHVAVRVPARTVGSAQLAARVQVVVADEVAAQGLVKAVWSDDEALTTRLDKAVAHYTGQAELAQVIQEGLAARSEGDEATATAKLGRAVKLATETHNDEATQKLAKLVHVDDAEKGTVRLKRDISKLDEMALDTASTKTTRVRT